MVANTSNNPAFVYDNIVQNPTIQNPSTAYTVLAGDNGIVCGANSIAITLTATSNSPVWITSIDGTTQRTGCTIVIGSQDYVIADNGCAALCMRYGAPSANTWFVVGAKTAS